MIAVDDVQRARVRISPRVKRTVLEQNTTLSRELGTSVHLKLELFQKTGSFTPGGAFTQILQLTPDQRKRAMVAVSSGNNSLANWAEYRRLSGRGRRRTSRRS